MPLSGDGANAASAPSPDNAAIDGVNDGGGRVGDGGSCFISCAVPTHSLSYHSACASPSTQCSFFYDDDNVNGNANIYANANILNGNADIRESTVVMESAASSADASDNDENDFGFAEDIFTEIPGPSSITVLPTPLLLFPLCVFVLHLGSPPEI